MVAAERQPIVPLYAYQQRWLMDRAKRKAAKWCRGAGKTFAVMLEPVIDCLEAEADGRRVQWFCFSGAEGQTKEMIRQAGIHAQGFRAAFKAFDEQIEVGREKFTQHVVEFHGGSRVVGLPTNPLSIRGRHGNLIWDEAGKTPNDEEIWGAAAPIAGRGFKIRVVGTPGAHRGPFYEILTGAREGWSVHDVNIYQAIKDGCPLDLEHIQSAVGKGRRWITEYLCEFEDAEARLVPLAQILACEDISTLQVPFLRIDEDREREWKPYLTRRPALPPSEGYDEVESWTKLFAPLAGKRELFLGFDVGRKRDLSVLWIVEPDGQVRSTRACIAFKGRRFAEQRAALWAAAEHCRRLCIDATGIGAQLAEETVEKYGEHKVEAVTFTNAVKEDMAVRQLRGFEDRSLRTPPVAEVRESINAVYKVTTAAGHTRYDADATEEAGHADYFWAQGLALLAAGDGPSAMPFIETSQPYRWNRKTGFIV